jgi:hypothetical protein
MTPKQETLHWRSWNAVVRANVWKMRRGVLAEEARRDGNEELRKVWVLADQIARKHYRAVTPDDLRHATYCVAAGRDVSHADLTNKEFNRVLALWEVLASPDDLGAQMDWENPERRERRGLVNFIQKKAPGEAYVIAISTRKHGARDWRSLPIQELRNLSMTISQAARKREERGLITTDNEPF